MHPKPDDMPPPLKGRGAVRNLPGRFERVTREPFDDGWTDRDEKPAALRTVVTPDPARTILTRNDSPDIPYEVSINPYKGCEHGCVYCFARPTHSFLDLSPGLDFESRIFSKPHAPELLRQALRKPSYVAQPIAIGSNTDPYQPVERRLKITRAILEVLVEHRHPFSLITKSNLVLRDLDLLGPMAAENRAAVHVSITTFDRTLARRMEPRAPTPERRLAALRGLRDAGVPTGVLASPMIPGLNDTELERILKAGAGAGAESAGYVLLRLPHELKQLFTDWVRAHYPDREAKIFNRLRQMRGGRLYDARFGVRMRGVGGHADLLKRRFELACRRLGLSSQRRQLDCSTFRVPPRAGDQGRLFAWPAGEAI
jgi:DNA repair photolyase